MTRPNPLPRDLRGRRFTTATALVAGVDPGRLRAKDLSKAVHGVRAAAEPADPLERCAMFLERIPSGIVSHATAAMMHALPLPAHLEASPVVDLSLLDPARAPHARGLRGHRLKLDADEVVSIGGVRVTSPTRTFVDLAGALDLPDLVAVGDQLLRSRAADRNALFAAVDAHPGARGITRLRTAVLMLSDRAESPQESRLRATLMMNGLPEPTSNHEVRVAGAVLSRIDLAYVERRIAIEYQGDYHRDKNQWRADITRRTRLETYGWTVVEAAANDITDPTAILARLRRLLA